MGEIPLSAPQDVKATGVSRGLLEDLALKILYLNSELSIAELAERMCLDLGVVEELFQFFRKEQLCEVKGMSAGSHRIVATSQGKARANDLLKINQYTGPAPVSLLDYTLRVRAKSVQQTQISPLDLGRAFHPLVMDEELLKRLGTALVSGTSIFLYGPAGTGKTSIACSLPAIYNDLTWIPHAVEVENQIVTVFDPGVHRESRDLSAPYSDPRWVLCHRPQVVTGGELSAGMLDLQYNEVCRFCTAPLQMKANTGALIIDDFGRQRMRPEELLNRWMTPLDRRLDFLTLPGGKKFEIPFDVIVVFATNLDPAELADEAFLRRIPNKIRVDHATSRQFAEIFRRECEKRLLDYDDRMVLYLIRFITLEMKQSLAQCYPRDLINQIVWAAAYLNSEPQITVKTLEDACRNYFLPAAKSRAATP